MPNEPLNSNAALVDSNIIIYSYDEDEPAKQAVAVALIRELADNDALVFSVQSFNEFYNIARRERGGLGLSHENILVILNELSEICVLLELTPRIIFRAYEAIGRYGFSLWDALIWAVAKENRVDIIYTEDAQSAEVIEGVRYINPFAVSGES